MRTISAVGSTVRNAVAAAKRLLGQPRLRIVTDSSSGDHLHRITLSSGDVVEVTVVQHARASAHEV